MPKNVLNTEELDRFLNRIVEDFLSDTDDLPKDAAIAWLKKAGRRWMINTYPETGRIVSINALGDKETPGTLRIAWSDKLRRGGQTTEITALPRWFRRNPDPTAVLLDLNAPKAREFTVQLTRAFAHVNGQAEKLGAARLARISVPDAIHAAGKLAAAAQAKAKSDGTALLLDLKDGFTLVHLTGEAALADEGEQMGHCVGDYGATVRFGRAEILSLRDGNGHPHATIEVLGGLRVTQMKGKGNMPVDARYRPYIRHAVDALGLTLEADRDMIGLTARGFAPHDPNSWLNHPDLPGLIQAGLNQAGGEEYAILLNDVAAALPEADPAFLDWVETHFVQGPTGPVHADRERNMNLFGAKIRVLNLAMSDEIWDALGRNRTPAARRLRRHMADVMATTLLDADRDHPRALIERPDHIDEIGIDWTPVRQERRERMKRLFSGFGATYARVIDHPRTPVARKQQWQRNWHFVRSYLNGSDYFFF